MLEMAKRRLVFYTGLCLFLIQSVQLICFAAINADIRPIVAATNSDAASGIDVAGRSQLYRDNGFAAYGPVYFRAANLAAATMVSFTQLGDWSEAEGRTKTLHFALMLVSVLAVAVLAWLLAFLITGVQNALTPLLASLLLYALLWPATWQKFILTAHPDHLLALTVAVAAWLSFQTWCDPTNEKLRRYSAWAWGVALATKMSVILFYPFALIALFTVTRPTLKDFARFIGHALLAYLIVGFPQNFNVPRTLKFLAYQSQFSQKATSESVLEWLSIYGQQTSGLICIAVLLLAFRRYQAPKTSLAKPILFATLLGIGPFLLMLGQNINAPHDHYPMPLIAAQMALLISVVGRFSAPRSITGKRQWLIPLALAVVFTVFGSIPRGFSDQLKSQMACRPEATVIYKRITQYLAAGKTIFADPYVPSMDKTPNLRSTWRPTRDYIAEGKFDVLVLNANHEDTYFRGGSAQDYINVYNANADATKSFYALFRAAGETVSDARIGHWKRVFKDQKCSWEIWTKE